MKSKNSKSLKSVEVLEMLQKMINSNDNLIRENTEEMESILNNEAPSQERKETINFYQNMNSDLLKKNRAFIELHRKLMNFLKFLEDKDTNFFTNQVEDSAFIKINKTDLTKNLLEKTIEEELIFDKSHPLYNDVEFREKLMNYYVTKEEYEKCAELAKLGVSC